MKVLIIGLPLFAKKLAADLNAADSSNKYVFCDTYYSYAGKLKFLFHLPSADIVHSINGTNYGSKTFELTLRKNKKLMMHWVGTDVLKSAKNLENNLVNKGFVENASHFCEPMWIKEELAQIGVNARLLTFTALDVAKGNIRGKPPAFSVLSYIGDNREVFYGVDNLLRLAGDYPDITFNIVGARLEKYNVPDNVNVLGWVNNLDELYRENILYLRLTEHDGLSNSVLEAMSMGCHIFWTSKFPNTRYVSGYESLKEEFRLLMTQFEEGGLMANNEGIEYIRNNYDRTEVLRSLVECYKEELNDLRTP